MKRYYFRKETPLKYHKFLWYVSLPLSILYRFVTIILYDFEASGGSWLAFLDQAYNVIGFVLMLAAFIGFFRWKSYAWYAIISIPWLSVAYNLIGLIVFALYVPDQITTPISHIITYGVYGCLLLIYYRKRRPLFFPQMIPADCTPEQNVVQAEGGEGTED